MCADSLYIFPSSAVGLYLKGLGINPTYVVAFFKDMLGQI
jgi:hypothetical protein